MKLTMADLQPRVEKGAAWLDANRPGWFNKVDFDSLDISDCDRCILGQVFGHFDGGMAALVDGYSGWEYYPQSGEHGFAAKHGDMPHSTTTLCGREQFWRTLRECWITAILERRAQQQEQPPSPDLVALAV